MCIRDSYYPALRQGFRSCWQECWTSDQRGAKLRNIKPSIGEWSSSHRRKRFHEVILARLRTGHTNITHSHYMSRDPPPICKFCRRHTAQSVHHIFIDCSHLYPIRCRYFPTLRSITPSKRLSHILSCLLYTSPSPRDS